MSVLHRCLSPFLPPSFISLPPGRHVGARPASHDTQPDFPPHCSLCAPPGLHPFHWSPCCQQHTHTHTHIEAHTVVADGCNSADNADFKHKLHVFTWNNEHVVHPRLTYRSAFTEWSCWWLFDTDLPPQRQFSALHSVRTLMENLEKSWNFKMVISRPGKVMEKT